MVLLRSYSDPCKNEVSRTKPEADAVLALLLPLVQPCCCTFCRPVATGTAVLFRWRTTTTTEGLFPSKEIIKLFIYSVANGDEISSHLVRQLLKK
jgi:hypothetical protein